MLRLINVCYVRMFFLQDTPVKEFITPDYDYFSGKCYLHVITIECTWVYLSGQLVRLIKYNFNIQ